jgi:hypothetical protein
VAVKIHRKDRYAPAGQFYTVGRAGLLVVLVTVHSQNCRDFAVGARAFGDIELIGDFPAPCRSRSVKRTGTYGYPAKTGLDQGRQAGGNQADNHAYNQGGKSSAFHISILRLPLISVNLAARVRCADALVFFLFFSQDKKAGIFYG